MSESEATRAFDFSRAQGVNFFDTANVYNQGESEEWLGRRLRGVPRAEVVISTKFGYRYDPRNPDSGGSHGTAMQAAVEKSLRRLGLDCIDMLYLHLWDCLTPPEVTLQAALQLVRQGKIRYFCLSNVPGWYAGCVHGLLNGTGVSLGALQINLNLLVREPEAEFFVFARHARVPLIAWGPLANGLLSGRYEVDLNARELTGAGRMVSNFCSGTLDPFQPRVVSVLETLRHLSAQSGCSPSVLSIAWLLSKPDISCVAVGFSSADQLAENLSAAHHDIDSEVFKTLDTASAVPCLYPYTFLEPEMQKLVHGERSRT